MSDKRYGDAHPAACICMICKPDWTGRVSAPTPPVAGEPVACPAERFLGLMRAEVKKAHDAYDDNRVPKTVDQKDRSLFIRWAAMSDMLAAVEKEARAHPPAAEHGAEGVERVEVRPLVSGGYETYAHPHGRFVRYEQAAARIAEEQKWRKQSESDVRAHEAMVDNLRAALQSERAVREAVEKALRTAARPWVVYAIDLAHNSLYRDNCMASLAEIDAAIAQAGARSGK